jgi:glycosyltransferase involved in cell wall biosynthesis
MSSLPNISVVIPTYQREGVLVQSILQLLSLNHRASEIIIVDQSESHTLEVQDHLTALERNGDIKWLRLAEPSIPNAMNVGAMSALFEVILFLDDDILTRSELVLEHAKCYSSPFVHGVAGQVIQSWQEELDSKHGSYYNDNSDDPDAFMFNSGRPCKVRRFIGCNVSFLRSELLDAGGFDLNFSKVAYRYEAESAERFVSSGRTLIFEPKASIHHLKEKSGGTRSYGDHLTSIKPSHSMGMYYYYLVVKNQHNRWRQFFISPFVSCATRFHLRNPWYIPVTFISQISGMAWAVYLRMGGQKLLRRSEIELYNRG